MSIEFHVDPDLWAVFKAVTVQKDALSDENAALRARVAQLEEEARLLPFWRRRAKHATKLLLAPKGCNCATLGGCSKCYTGPVTDLRALRTT